MIFKFKEEQKIIRVNLNLANSDTYDYVLIQKEYGGNLVEEFEHCKLLIIMIPLLQVRGINLFLYEHISRTWIAQVDSHFSLKENLFFKEINFAESSIEVPDSFKGRGLGSAIFSEFIKWAKQEHPGSKVKSLWLSENHAETEEEKNRRNGFYRNFGFELKLDDEGKSGTAEIENVDLLHEYYNPKKVEAMSFVDFVRDVVNINREYRDKNDLIKKEARKRIEKEKYKSNFLVVSLIVSLVLLIISLFR